MARALAGAGCVAAEEEAVELVAAAADPGVLDAMVTRRLTGEPLAWIVGTAPFCGLDVVVRTGVYVPRWQSEPLALAAAGRLPDDGVGVDLCTGSGAIALVLRATRPRARVLATELDPVAADCARANGVDVRTGDLFGALPSELHHQVDVVVGVLPYVPAGSLHLLPRDVVAFEPRTALDGGADGLALVERAVTESTTWVAPGGWLLLEVGGGQFDQVGAMMSSRGYGAVQVLEDGDGDPRAVCGRLDADAPVGS